MFSLEKVLFVFCVTAAAVVTAGQVKEVKVFKCVGEKAPCAKKAVKLGGVTGETWIEGAGLQAKISRNTELGKINTWDQVLVFQVTDRDGAGGDMTVEVGKTMLPNLPTISILEDLAGQTNVPVQGFCSGGPARVWAKVLLPKGSQDYILITVPAAVAERADIANVYDYITKNLLPAAPSTSLYLGPQFPNVMANLIYNAYKGFLIVVKQEVVQAKTHTVLSKNEDGLIIVKQEVVQGKKTHTVLSKMYATNRLCKLFEGNKIAMAMASKYCKKAAEAIAKLSTTVAPTTVAPTVSIETTKSSVAPTVAEF